jgi:ankyrin repeat protein
MKKNFYLIFLLIFLSVTVFYGLSYAGINEDIIDAVYQNDINKLRNLLKRWGNVNAKDNNAKTALMWAIELEKNQIVEILLKNGANINFKDSLGHTALHYATYAGNIETIKVLLKKGADPNTKNYNDETPLFSLKATPEILNLLLDAGANPNIQLKDSGNTPLIKAVSLKREQNIKILLQKGANIHLKNWGGQTALMTATWLKHNNIINLLKQAGAKY